MNAVFDILLLLVAIAAVWKLRSILGQRTGFERGQPLSKDVFLKKSVGQKTSELLEPIASTHAVQTMDKSTQKVLDSFKQHDRNFSVQDFIQGVQIAYKLIVETFAKGDMEGLKNLVQQNVAERFQAEIERRADKKHSAKATVEKIASAKIIKAHLKQGREKEAQITVEMKSRQIAWTEDEEGRIIAGDPNTTRDMKDVWTFERSLRNRDPNWRLVATGA